MIGTRVYNCLAYMHTKLELVKNKETLQNPPIYLKKHLKLRSRPFSFSEKVGKAVIVK